MRGALGRMLAKAVCRVVIGLVAFNARMLAQGEQPNYGSLTVLLSDYWGHPVTGRISIVDTHGVSIYDEMVNSRLTIRLTYGRYVVGLMDEFFVPIRREVTIDRDQAFLVLPARLAEINDAQPDQFTDVSIRVQPASACSANTKLWAKMIGVFSDYSATSIISPYGFALFESIYYGRYVLLVLDGEEVRATRFVDPKGKITTVNVELSACSR